MEEITKKQKLFNWMKKNKNDLIIYFGFLGILMLLIILAVVPQYGKLLNPNKDGFTSAYNPIAINIFGGIAWYAIFILAGIIMAAIMAFMEFKRMGWDTEDLLDGLLIIVPLSIVGARIYYVLFAPNTSFSEIFNIRDGGLAIHGAIIVAAISVYIFAKKKKLSLFVLVDMLAIGFLMGQITGRWGNFMNAEAHGPAVNSGFLNAILPNFIKFQMQFGDLGSTGSIGTIFQPTFLYESLWNLIGLSVLFVVRRKRILKTGDILGIYLIWYGVGRGYIETLRQDQLLLGAIPFNVLMSLIFIGLGVVYLILKRVYIKEEPYYADLAVHEAKFFNDPNAYKRDKSEKQRKKRYTELVIEEVSDEEIIAELNRLNMGNDEELDNLDDLISEDNDNDDQSDFI